MKTCKSLTALTAEIEQQATSIIPVLTLDEILNASEEKKDELREVGCFVVRCVVERAEATDWFQGLKGYVADNKAAITGACISQNFLLRKR